MTAVLKPSISDRRFASGKPATVLGGSKVAQFALPGRTRREKQLARIQGNALSTVATAQVVKISPSSQSVPSWLQLFIATQRTSSVVTFFLVAGVLSVYGWTVCFQQVWNQEYRRLEALQQNERQLTAANGVLENQISQQAESPDSGLVMPNPSDAIFLQAAPQRQPVAVEPDTSALEQTPSAPLGY